jgi:hypothetical protein
MCTKRAVACMYRRASSSDCLLHVQRLKEKQSDGRQQQDGAPGPGDANYDEEQQKEVDNRSVYVGNVEYNVTSAELAEFFAVCVACLSAPDPASAADFFLPCAAHWHVHDVQHAVPTFMS